jgi:hypothetical protein
MEALTITPKTACWISGGFALIFTLMFAYDPHGVLTKYQLLVPAVDSRGRRQAEPTWKEMASLYYFTVLTAMAMWSVAVTMMATARVGHTNTMKLANAAAAFGRAGLIVLIMQYLNEPMKKQLVVSGGLLVVQILGAMSGGPPSLPELAKPKSASGKAALLCACLSLLQMVAIVASGPVDYMAKMGIEIKHTTAAVAFEAMTQMWIAIVVMSSIIRITVVLGGDKDSIYAINRVASHYYTGLFGVFTVAKAMLGIDGPAAPSGVNVQFWFIFLYGFGSYLALVKDDMDAKKKM